MDACTAEAEGAAVTKCVWGGLSTREHKQLLYELQLTEIIVCPATVRTDQEKLLAQLVEDLEQSRELVRVQQELLQVLIMRFKFARVRLVSKMISYKFYS